MPVVASPKSAAGSGYGARDRRRSSSSHRRAQAIGADATPYDGGIEALRTKLMATCATQRTGSASPTGLAAGVPPLCRPLLALRRPRLLPPRVRRHRRPGRTLSPRHRLLLPHLLCPAAGSCRGRGRGTCGSARRGGPPPPGRGPRRRPCHRVSDACALPSPCL
jgi:hypothetical protein